MQDPIPEPDAAKIAYYGDSTVWGADGRPWPNPSVQYPDDNVPTLVGQLLAASDLTTTPTVVNHGHPGLSTLPRLCGRAEALGLVAPWSTEMSGPTGRQIPVYGTAPTHVPEGTDAKWVINNTLINDIAVAKGVATPENIESYYLKLIDTAAQQQRQMVIETPNPVFALDDQNVTKFIRYVEAQRRAAAQRNVPLIDQFRLIPHVLPAWGTHFSDGSPQKVHPDASMYRLKALISFWTLYELLSTNAPPKWDPPRAALIEAHAALNVATDPKRAEKAQAILVPLMPSKHTPPQPHTCVP